MKYRVLRPLILLGKHWTPGDPETGTIDDDDAARIPPLNIQSLVSLSHITPVEAAGGAAADIESRVSELEAQMAALIAQAGDKGLQDASIKPRRRATG